MFTHSKTWFVIINPASGNGKGKREWPNIEALLKLHSFEFEHHFTKYPKHSVLLVKQAITRGMTHILCVGGDGTLHNIVNGIMSQKTVPSHHIMVGMIPVGTGNDWVKSHKIPMSPKDSIKSLLNGYIKQQDIGKIEFKNQKRAPVYFNNVAGVGFDGHIVSKVHKYKYLGKIAYLFGAIIALFSYRNFLTTITSKSITYSGKTLMALVGICQYSGGGMQLTKNPNPFDGLFDVSIAKDFNKIEIIQNLGKIYNGKIINHHKVISIKTDAVTINLTQHPSPYIEADGELIGKGTIKISLVPKAFSFYS